MNHDSSAMRIVFMGTPAFAVAILSALIAGGFTVVLAVTQPDRPVGRKRILTPTPVKELALRHGIPVLQPEKVRDAEALSAIASYRPDVIVTAAYGQILPESLLQIPTHLALNVHGSLLPKYRGGAPIQRAIMDGAAETGVTIMTMVKAMDAGPMWASVALPILSTDTYGTLHDRLAQAGASLLVETLPRIVRGEISPIDQDAADVTFAPTLTRADECVDFAQDADVVDRQIRALAPHPGAYAYIGDKLVKIWYATPDRQYADGGQPGCVVGQTDRGPIVRCGRGAVVLEQLQWEGKTVQTGAEFCRGQRDLLSLRLTKDRYIQS